MWQLYECSSKTKYQFFSSFFTNVIVQDLPTLSSCFREAALPASLQSVCLLSYIRPSVRLWFFFEVLKPLRLPFSLFWLFMSLNRWCCHCVCRGRCRFCSSCRFFIFVVIIAVVNVVIVVTLVLGTFKPRIKPDV